MLFLLDASNSGKSFTNDQLALNLGYTSGASFRASVDMTYLLSKKYVKRVDGKYSQNFSELV